MEVNKSALLTNPFWNNTMIQEYAGCGKTTASKIRREAILKYGGAVPYNGRLVKRDAVLKVLGISTQQELYYTGLLLKENNNND